MKLNIQEHNTGEKWPRGMKIGQGRPFSPKGAKPGGPRVHKSSRFGQVDGGDGTHFTPKPIKAGGPQTHESGKKFGQVDPGAGTHFNPKKPKASG